MYFNTPNTTAPSFHICVISEKISIITIGDAPKSPCNMPYKMYSPISFRPFAVVVKTLEHRAINSQYGKLNPKICKYPIKSLYSSQRVRYKIYSDECGLPVWVQEAHGLPVWVWVGRAQAARPMLNKVPLTRMTET